ncbi:universal stress protein [Providencia sneebia]|uniref:Universal stress protein F n=1 Tax=Providencia sneebia DSM 19967 TaxID=1141660 RepID=K8W9J3_9GAMM|nr:universal stress protein [Providencia sneebia]EKT57323.1 universal stress protein F [Providencia sneebia DSM 19967]
MYKNILVPIDITEKSLSDLVLPHIQYLAEPEDTRIHFLAVIPTVPFYTSMGFGFAEQADNEQDKVTLQLSEIIKEFNLPKEKYTAQIIMGSPRDEILDVADKIKADLIVIGSRKPGVSTYFLGSTATMIIQNSKISVFAVR